MLCHVAHNCEAAHAGAPRHLHALLVELLLGALAQQLLGTALCCSWKCTIRRGAGTEARLQVIPRALGTPSASAQQLSLLAHGEGMPLSIAPAQIANWLDAGGKAAALTLACICRVLVALCVEVGKLAVRPVHQLQQHVLARGLACTAVVQGDLGGSGPRVQWV